jgi:nucleotide-binding universal stress UspA family protein
MILICFDGSDDAQAAVEHAARLFKGESATILTVWQLFTGFAAQSALGFGMSPAIPDVDQIDEASRKAAEETVAQGVELAQGLGLNAEPRVATQHSSTGRAILTEAADVQADAIVMGSRGLGGVKSLLLGSVSHEVIQHADRAVVVVPSATVAASRAREVREEDAA